MINPGYRGTAKEQGFKSGVGTLLRCPKCKRPICEGKIISIYVRCRGCGHWVYLERVEKE